MGSRVAIDSFWEIIRPRLFKQAFLFDEIAATRGKEKHQPCQFLDVLDVDVVRAEIAWKISQNCFLVAGQGNFATIVNSSNSEIFRRYGLNLNQIHKRTLHLKGYLWQQTSRFLHR
jgi:hypothetical protein